MLGHKELDMTEQLYDGDLSLPLGLALGSPIFPSGCEGKLGVALEQEGDGSGPHEQKWGFDLFSGLSLSLTGTIRNRPSLCHPGSLKSPALSRAPRGCPWVSEACRGGLLPVHELSPSCLPPPLTVPPQR